MDLERIIAVWSHCYHVTFEKNLASIRQWHALLPAQVLFEAAAAGELCGGRRSCDIVLRIRGEQVVVRNQRALDPASLDLGPDGTLGEYVACLNSRTYFWPGTLAGPRDDGLTMLGRPGPASVMLRIPSRSLIGANPASRLYVSKCNTGAARMEDGLKSRRGPDVFELCERFCGRGSDIVEISFPGAVDLPSDTTYAGGPGGPWRPLFP